VQTWARRYRNPHKNHWSLWSIDVLTQKANRKSRKSIRLYGSKLLEIDTLYTNRLRIAEKPGLIRVLAIFFAHSGDSWFWILGLGLLWWLGDEYWRLRAGIMLLSILATAILVMLIKFTVRRKRPVGEWGEIYRKTDPHSFPSGHSARAFMLSTLALGLGPSWLGILLFAWAPLVILSRVAMGVHYLSDVLIGAMIGILIGLVILGSIPLLPFPV